MAIIGIDLGTTNSLATIYKDDRVQLIRNTLGKALTPSVVGIDDEGNVIVGDVAKERLVTHPDLTAAEFKRTMGTDREYSLGDKKFSSQQLSSIVLRKIVADAKEFLGEEIEEAVISVPAYFNDKMRIATKQAAELAGIKCERLINEPSAAALAYLHEHEWKDGTYMVVDFGGGTLDVSIIDSFDSVMEIIAVAGNNQLGGKDFNEAVYHRFLDENLLDENLLTAEQKASIYKTAETCKIALSSVPMSIMSVNINDKNYTLTLDNNSLIKIAHEVFEKIGEPVRRVLRDSHMNVSEVKDIILVGGSCKMPTVAAYVERLTGRKPCTDIDPDTAICVGAGIFAGMKNRNVDFKDVILTDICPFSLGTDVLDMRTREQIMDFIIQRNSMLPSSKTHEYYAASDNQTELRIVIYQGESIVPSNNIKLGELRLNCPPTPIHEFIASVRLTYDINGILVVDVTTSDKKTHSKVILSESNTMSEEELAKCKSQLDKLRLAPSGEEQYQLLIARAERIIEETLSFERRQITEALLSYKSCLKNGNERDIRIFTKKFARFLDQIEGKDTGLSDEEI